MKEALSLWEERERTRAEILAAVDEAEVSLARGEGRARHAKFGRWVSTAIASRSVLLLRR